MNDRSEVRPDWRKPLFVHVRGIITDKTNVDRRHLIKPHEPQINPPGMMRNDVTLDNAAYCKWIT